MVNEHWNELDGFNNLMMRLEPIKSEPFRAFREYFVVIEFPIFAVIIRCKIIKKWGKIRRIICRLYS